MKKFRIFLLLILSSCISVKHDTYTREKVIIEKRYMLVLEDRIVKIALIEMEGRKYFYNRDTGTLTEYRIK